MRNKTETRPQNDGDGNPAGSNSGRSVKDLISTYGIFLLLAIVGFAITWQFVEPAPPRHLVMAAGSADGAYYRFGLEYQEILARHGIQLDIVETTGSVQNLELLEDPDSSVDVALLQGNIGGGDNPSGLTALASTFYEPMWIFQRVPAAVMLGDFVGRSVAMGEPGSGSLSAFRRLIELNGLTESNFEIVPLGGTAAAEALLNGDVDAAGFVSSEHAPYILQLLHSEGIHLVSFIRAEAYMRQSETISSVVLPRGAADLRLDLPPADVQMLAPIASLTAKPDLHPTLALLLVQAAVEVHSGAGLFEKQGEFPSVYNTIFPLNEDARRYLEKGPPFLQRYLPFWVAVTFDRLLVLLIPLLTLLFPLFKIAPPTYRWRIRRRIYKHYQYLFDIETSLMNAPSIETLDSCLEQIEHIEDDLAEISVPLSYADQLYHLRMHLRFMRQRIEQTRLDCENGS